jgi:heterogeneous nuclear ribonucleoprotein L
LRFLFQDRFDDPHKPNPSPVVHVRGLSDAAIEADLVEAVQHFGNVRDVIMMPRRKQALIEFEVCMSLDGRCHYNFTIRLPIH